MILYLSVWPESSYKFFYGFFSGRTSRKNTTCGATHHVHVDIPEIFIRHPGRCRKGFFMIYFQQDLAENKPPAEQPFDY
jgi:hypothetical protein